MRLIAVHETTIPSRSRARRLSRRSCFEPERHHALIALPARPPKAAHEWRELAQRLAHEMRRRFPAAEGSSALDSLRMFLW